MLPVVIGTLACGGFCMHILGIIVGGVGALTDSFCFFAMAQASWRQAAGGVGGCLRNFDLILEDYRRFCVVFAAFFFTVFFDAALYVSDAAGTMAGLQASCRWVAVAALVALLCRYLHYPGCGPARSIWRQVAGLVSGYIRLWSFMETLLFVVFATMVYFYLYYVEFGRFPVFFYTVFFDAALYVSDAAGHHICTHLAHCWHGYNGYLDATFHIVVLVPSGLTLYAKVAGSLRQASLHYSDSALFIAALVPAGMFILAIFAAIFIELGRYPAFFHAFYIDAMLLIVLL